MMKGKPKDRILETTQRLFYEQGYDATGINQILDESNTHKNSLYKYFESKKELGIAYLAIQKNSIIEFIRKLSNQNPNINEFIGKWVKMIYRQSHANQFKGCPFANFSSQTLTDHEEFKASLKEALNEWIFTLAEYFETCKATKQIDKDIDTKDLATQLVAIYEGNIQLYLLSGDKSYILRIEKDFMSRLE